jgi:Ca2+-binding RTX toxin-like protein
MPTYTGDDNNNVFAAPNDGLAWVFSGKGGNDTLTGGVKDDKIDGGAGNDTLNGGAGNDTIIGGAGYDTLNGGDGDDILIDTDGIVDGGAGIDTLKADYSLFNNGVGIEVGYNGENAIYSDDNSITPGSGLAYNASVLLRYSNVEKFEITGTQYADVLRGGANNDILKGGAGNDILDGGAGNDTLDGGTGNDTITGGAGNDTITGGAGIDTLNGGDGDDILIDTDGTVDGGAGIDTLRADYSLLNNGAGVHVGYLGQNQIFSRFSGQGILGYSNIEKFEITGSKYADVLQGGANNDILKGGAGNDDIRGGAGNDILDGGTGNDYLFGGDGNDILIDTEGTVDGGAGTDTLRADYSLLDNGAGVHVGYLGQNQIFSRLTGLGILGYSNIEKFEITGTKYADILQGGASNDILSGGAGNDTITGGVGNDTLTGGLGADKFVFNSKLEGIDVIKDFSWVEGDKIQISKVGFGITDVSSFSYNGVTGSLLFQGTQFATLENKPAGFNVTLDIQLV